MTNYLEHIDQTIVSAIRDGHKTKLTVNWALESDSETIVFTATLIVALRSRGGRAKTIRYESWGYTVLEALDKLDAEVERAG